MWEYSPVGLGNIRLWQQQDPQSVNEGDQYILSLCHSHKQYMSFSYIVVLQVCNRWYNRHQWLVAVLTCCQRSWIHKCSQRPTDVEPSHKDRLHQREDTQPLQTHTNKFLHDAVQSIRDFSDVVESTKSKFKNMDSVPTSDSSSLLDSMIALQCISVDLPRSSLYMMRLFKYLPVSFLLCRLN